MRSNVYLDQKCALCALTTHTKGKGRRKSSAKYLFQTKTNKNQNTEEDMKRQKRYNFYLSLGNHRHAIIAYVKCYTRTLNYRCMFQAPITWRGSTFQSYNMPLYIQL